MAKTSEFDPIDFLVARKYNLIQGMGVGSPPRSAEAEAQRRKARRKYEKLAAKYRLELSQKSRAELDALVEAARTEDREWLAAKQEKDESARPFNRPSAVATVPTYTYWAKLVFWSVDETVALLLERNPKPVTWEMVKPHVTGFGFRSSSSATVSSTLQKTNFAQ